MLFFGFHQQNVEFAALPIASWLSASNVDTLPTPPSSVFSRLSQPKTVAKQLEEAAVAALPPNPTIEDLPKITWKNRRFVQEDSLARKGAKGRKSWIRSHGTFLVELNYQDQPIGHVWCCNRCDMKGAAEFFSVQATSSAADHLRKHSSPDHPSQPDLGHWRTKGPIGKLRNIVKFIRSLPQRSEQFKRIAREQNYEGYRLCEESTAELEVVMNNETRWNSTYMMIERALRKQTDIRAFLFAIQEKENEARRIPADDMLSSEDWRVLGAVNEILKPIYLQTMRTQGWGKGDSCGRLWEVLIGMEYLLEHFEDWKVFYSEVTEETMGETQVDAAERIATASANFRESNGRPSRVRRLPARFDEDEVYALLQRSQPTRFIESALLLHSRAEYSTAEKRSASETSQKSTLPADHRAYIRASINNGWKKLNEYYDKLGESPLFAAAIILHPRFGISWLEATWVSEE
ncbi:hypothetical protein HZS61_004367 [Fusarium oxysporum f. sp. conglutinans]|uniref:HAT C-terminal dimerisation domain-containing protein n=1 Tax=Fusarium oxysporum f. sp. conglutinans TaxID=100902 RepID=A0A8H6LDY6_FUSOX|nr:hypothetical protein HZS61_004367 [Fusarium oxysporum f. sp. conglutinans]